MAGLGMIDQAVKSINTVEEYIKVGMEMATEGALDFMENKNNKNSDEAQQKMNEYRQVLLEFVGLETEINQLQDAVKDLPTSRDVVLETVLEQKMADLQQAAGNKGDNQHTKLIEFNQKMLDLQNGDDKNQAPEPSMTATVTEDDVEMTQERINTKCPYTGKDMVFPMKNKICGHIYDRDGIAEYIKLRKKKAKCPLGGCSNDKPIDMADLEEHSELRRYIERMNRSKKHKK